VKDKDDVGYIEKERKYRDRSKKRRGDKMEDTTSPIKPKLEPYHKPKRKNWSEQTDEEQE